MEIERFVVQQRDGQSHLSHRASGHVHRATSSLGVPSFCNYHDCGLFIFKILKCMNSLYIVLKYPGFQLIENHCGDVQRTVLSSCAKPALGYHSSVEISTNQ